MDESPSNFDAESVNSIVDHMNEDHADALQLYIKAFTDIEADSIDNLRMTNLDADGICLSYANAGATNLIKIPFQKIIGKRLKSVNGARGALVAMVKIARQ